MNPVTRQQQRLTRRGNQSVPTVVDASRLEVSPDEIESRHHLVLQSAGRAATPLIRRSGIDETRPWRRQRASRISWPRSHTIARGRRQLHGSGCRGRPDPPAWCRTKAGGKKHPEVIEAIEILLEHDTAGDPITGIRWTHKTPAGIAELLRQLDIQIVGQHRGATASRYGFSLRVNRKAVPPTLARTATNSSDTSRRCVPALSAKGFPLSASIPKSGNGRQFQKQWRQVGSNARAR